MKRKKCLVILLVILFCSLLGTKVNASENVTASNWAQLKNAIENNSETDLEVNLSGTSWTADSTITISER